MPASWARAVFGPIVLLQVLMVFAPARPAPAAIPGANDPKAYTEHDYIRDELEMCRNHLVEGYQRFGRRKDTWDGPAIRFLEGICSRLTIVHQIVPVDEFAYLHWQNSGPDEAELLRRGQQVIQAGCEDPLILYYYGWALVRNGRGDEASPFFVRAADGMRASGYSPLRKLLAARRAVESSEAAQSNSRHQQMFSDLLLEIAVQQSLTRQERRMLGEILNNDLDTLTPPRRKQLLEKLAATPCDPWMAKMIVGNHHFIEIGLNNPLLPMFIPEQRQGVYSQHLSEAQACFEAAHELHPDLPHAAANLITVHLVRQQESSEESPVVAMRRWFDRATAAQFDFEPAYTRLLEGLGPMWHGSQEELLAFGLECAGTGRFDTRVPWFLMTAIERARDTGGGWGVLEHPDVLNEVVGMLDGYAEEIPGLGAGKDWLRSIAAGLCWHGNQWDRGLGLIHAQRDHRPHQAWWNGFSYAGTLPGRTRSGLHALGGAHADQLRAAEKHAAQGQPLAAAEAYEQLAGQLAQDDPALRFVQGRAREHRWAQPFNAGEWADLSPQESLAGWYADEGDWQARPGEIVVELQPGQTQIGFCGLKAGRHLELEATIQLDPPDAEAGLTFFGVNSFNAMSCFFRPSDGRLRVFSHQHNMEMPLGLGRHPSGQRVRMRVLQRGAFVAIFLNDKQVFASGLGMGDIWTPDYRIGLAAQSAQGPATVRFSEIRIRKPSKKPAPATDSQEN